MARRPHRNNTTGYRGVTWDKEKSKFRAMICYQGKVRYLGYFVTAEDAARRYDEEAKALRGDWAALNFRERNDHAAA